MMIYPMAQCSSCRTTFADAELEWDGLNYSQPCPRCPGTVYGVQEGETYTEMPEPQSTDPWQN